ncbi:hypothetical protein TL16_g05725 [Triparma laevis f. inornata]|uniref:Uncharacterized protein n=1 Tax=Triparma laevis f. inornata TaxID=1714386 RepID=A0A9W7ANU0_9STRA|nr:hypothetical protein TL16_g05725 [Triparma laevis f. inornata]
MIKIYIQNNRFSGTLPDFSATPGMRFPTNLQKLYTFNNDFSGTLSPTLFDLELIQDVILSGNTNLKGALPTLLSTPSLKNLAIGGCSFSGPLPTNITSPLTSFYLEGNSFSSSIPTLPPTIVDVSLAYNHISGTISDNFS